MTNSKLLLVSLLLSACAADDDAPSCTLQEVYGGLGVVVRTAGPLRLEVVATDAAGEDTLALDAPCTAGGCRATGSRFVLYATTFPPPTTPTPDFIVAAYDGADQLGPDQATLRLRDAGGAIVAEQLVTPSYDAGEPFGAGCGVVEVASAAIETP